MTADDVIKGAQGKPVPFEFYGFTYLLRPLTRAEILKLRDGSESGIEIQSRIVALVVCDEAGKPLLAESQVALLPNAAIEALADEIAKRNWLSPEGKADPVKTPA